MPAQPANIYAEKLAYWFFRLNGCLTIENFVVHPDERGSQRTDADIVGVRFPHRKELATSSSPMDDYARFEEFPNKTMLFIAEVKLRKCELNGPWTGHDQRNVHRVLNAIGAFPAQQVEDVAASLYCRQFYEDDSYVVRMLTLGDEAEARYLRERPHVVQLTWRTVLQFIHGRFQRYKEQKGDHNQWDRTAKDLWRAAQQSSTEEFVQTIRERLVDGRGRQLLRDPGPDGELSS